WTPPGRRGPRGRGRRSRASSRGASSRREGGGGRRSRSCGVARRVRDAGGDEGALPLGALGAGATVREPAWTRARERQLRRQVPPGTDHVGLLQVLERRADPDPRAECPPGAPPEIGEEARRRVGERVIGEEGERDRRDPVAGAMDGRQAAEE